MGKFYTPEKVANLMVNLIDNNSIPNNAIDICCGSWNLLKAAKQHWPHIQLTGIDINEQLHEHTLNQSSFFCMDGRDFSLQAYINNQKYSIVVANPPFGKEALDVASQFCQLPGYYEMNALALHRIETTMVLANLSLLSENGILIIIVPSTVINGDWALNIRKYIAENYYLNKIVHLPSDVFGKDISTSLLVIENRKSKSRFVPIHKAEAKKNGKYKLTFVTRTTQIQAKTGRWEYIDDIAQQDISFQIKRGQIGNNLLEQSGLLPVIHSTDIELIKKPNWKPTRHLKNTPESTTTIPYAENGDIIIIRVGRNSGLAARLNTHNRMMLSDCVYVLKSNDQEVLESIWGILNSIEYQEDLDSIRKGVTTKYITIESLKNYLNNKLEEKGGAVDDYYPTRGACAG